MNLLILVAAVVTFFGTIFVMTSLECLVPCRGREEAIKVLWGKQRPENIPRAAWISLAKSISAVAMAILLEAWLSDRWPTASLGIFAVMVSVTVVVDYFPEKWDRIRKVLGC